MLHTIFDGFPMLKTSWDFVVNSTLGKKCTYGLNQTRKCRKTQNDSAMPLKTAPQSTFTYMSEVQRVDDI